MAREAECDKCAPATAAPRLPPRGCTRVASNHRRSCLHASPRRSARARWRLRPEADKAPYPASGLRRLAPSLRGCPPGSLHGHRQVVDGSAAACSTLRRRASSPATPSAGARAKRTTAHAFSAHPPREPLCASLAGVPTAQPRTPAAPPARRTTMSAPTRGRPFEGERSRWRAAASRHPPLTFFISLPTSSAGSQLSPARDEKSSGPLLAPAALQRGRRRAHRTAGPSPPAPRTWRVFGREPKGER